VPRVNVAPLGRSAADVGGSRERCQDALRASNAALGWSAPVGPRHHVSRAADLDRSEPKGARHGARDRWARRERDPATVQARTSLTRWPTNIP